MTEDADKAVDKAVFSFRLHPWNGNSMRQEWRNHTTLHAKSDKSRMYCYALCSFMQSDYILVKNAVINFDTVRGHKSDTCF
jgi:hypothetical protein